MASTSTGADSQRDPLSVRAGRWSLALAVAGSALAVGTVHTLTLCVVVAILAVAASLSWWRAEHMNPRPAATLLLFTGLALTAYTWLQSVPVPVSVLAAIAPHNADVWARALAPLREPGLAWAPLSLDPIATRVEALKGVAYVLAFVTALRVARRHEGVAFLTAVIVVTAILLAAAALLHPAFGVRKLYGVYEPGPGVAERHIAPLMNPNHLAAYLNIAFCFLLAAATAPEPKVPRPITMALAVLLASVQMWVASRGGITGMLLGALLVTVMAWAARRKRRGVGGLVGGLSAAVAVAAFAAMALGSSEDLKSEVFDANVSKLDLVVQALRIVPFHPLFGVGRGAFESAFPRYRGRDVPWMMGHFTFTHPENVVVQWVAEWGIPVALAGFAAITWALRPNAAFARSTRAVGAWTAVVVTSVQNLADFNSEVPGVTLSAVVCAAIVVAGSAGRAPRGAAQRWAARPRWVVAAAVLAAGIGTVLGAFGLGKELDDDRERLHEAAVIQPVPVDDLLSDARAAILRHPSEPYLPFVVGVRQLALRSEQAVLWMEATLERAQVYGPAHVVLAKTMASRSRSQARFEYRLAFEQSPEVTDGTLPEAVALVDDYWDALEITPSGRAGLRVLEGMLVLLERRLPSTCVQLESELAARSADAPEPLVAEARDTVDDIEAGDAAPWCDGAARDACIRRALERARRAESVAPDQCASHEAYARAVIASGDVEGGLGALQRSTDSVRDRVDCLKRLALLGLRYQAADQVSTALTRIANTGCNDDAQCVANLLWAARVETSRGNQGKAMALYKRAFERAPDDDALLERIAATAASAGLHGEAADDYERLARRHPAEPRWREAAQKERDEAMANAPAP